MLDDSVPDEELKPFATDVDFPVFYVNYNLYPQWTAVEGFDQPRGEAVSRDRVHHQPSA